MSGHDDEAATMGEWIPKPPNLIKLPTAKAPQPEPTPEPQPLWCDDDDWDEGEIPQRPWLVPGLLLRGAVTVMAGAGGSAKSLFSVALATSAALGKPLGRFQAAQPCKVLLLNAEDDALEQRRRLSAALRQFGATPRDLKGKVRRVGPNGLGTLFASADGKGGATLAPTPAMALLETWTEEFQPDLIIVDPLVELHDCDENSNTALRAVIAHLRSFAIKRNVALLAVHHSRKGAAAPGDPDAARGASALIGAARVVVTVNAMSEDDARGLGLGPEQRRHYFRLDDAKANYSPLHEATWFEKVVHALDNGEAVPAATPWEPPKDAITAELMVAIEAAVRQGNEAGLPWSKGKGGGERAIRNLFARHGITTAEGTEKALAELDRAGFHEAEYVGTNRHKHKGIRSPDGLPSTVAWTD